MREDFAVLSEPLFRRLYAARTVSQFGSAIGSLALAFAVLGVPGGSVGDLGLVLGARTLAGVLFLLYGGVLADRKPRYRLLVGSDLMAFVAQASMAAMFLTGRTPLAGLMGAAAVTGAAEALFGPALRGLVPQVVTQERRQSANALLRLALSATSIAGAPVAGLLVVLGGSGLTLALDAATFLISAALLTGLRLPVRVDVPQMRLLQDLREGWREVRSRQWVCVVVVQFAVVNLCFAPSIFVLGPVLANDYMGGAGAWALVLTAQAVGLVGGGVVAMRLRPRRPMRLATLATFGFLPPFLLLASQAPVWLVAASMLVNGLCADVFEVLWETSLQNHVNETALSRVASYDTVGSLALGPLGLALVGPVSEVLGTSTTLLVTGSLLALANVAALFSPAVRALPWRPSTPVLVAT